MDSTAIFAGDYRILRPLGQGGMGSVYLAIQLSTGRKRALKVLLPEQHHNPRIREQFIAEARIAAALDSDHVADVIAAGIDPASGSPWLALEYLEGETLEARVKRAAGLAPAEVQEIMRQICHALGQAHSAGLVHRDIKPANLFVADPRREGVPFTIKVLDFGIATLVEGRPHDAMSQPIGSPRWMAPEQAEPHRASPATDVWALGLVAYYCLAGKTLWETVANQGNPSLAEIVARDVPKASERAREHGVMLPAGFDAWFEHCVARDPARRFPDAWHVLRALQSWETASHELPVSAPAPVPPAPAPSAQVTWSAAPLAMPGDTRATAPPTVPASQSNAPVTGGGTYAPVLADRNTGASSAPIGRSVAGVMIAGALAAAGLLALALVVGVIVYVSPDFVAGDPTASEPASPSAATSQPAPALTSENATPSATPVAPQKVASNTPRTTATTTATSTPKSPDEVAAPPDTPRPASGLAPFDRAKATARVNAAAASATSQCKSQKNSDAGVETYNGEIGFRPDGTISQSQTGNGGARTCVSQRMRLHYGEYAGPPGTDPSVHLESVKYTVTIQ